MWLVSFVLLAKLLQSLHLLQFVQLVQFVQSLQSVPILTPLQFLQSVHLEQLWQSVQRVQLMFPLASGEALSTQIIGTKQKHDQIINANSLLLVHMVIFLNILR
jgi:hypothetical protein